METILEHAQGLVYSLLCLMPSAYQKASFNALIGIRHLAVNLLSQEQSAIGGTRAKRLRAGWDDQYLTQILAPVPTPAGKL